MTRPVRYNPPAPEKLDQFAREVCHELGTDYRAGEIAHGLANFMKVLARAYAKDLNKKNEEPLDNGPETA